jgi:hypothetical protein
LPTGGRLLIGLAGNPACRSAFQPAFPLDVQSQLTGHIDLSEPTISCETRVKILLRSSSSVRCKVGTVSSNSRSFGIKVPWIPNSDRIKSAEMATIMPDRCKLKHINLLVRCLHQRARGPKDRAYCPTLPANIDVPSYTNSSQNLALRRNLTDGPFYAAFLKATNSVLVAAMRWALSSR